MAWQMPHVLQVLPLSEHLLQVLPPLRAQPPLQEADSCADDHAYA